MDRRKRWTTMRVLFAAGALCYGVLIGRAVTNISGDGGSGSGGGVDAKQFSLRGKKPADPPNLGEFVANRTAAIALGKALFWDTQAGGDGVQACASCHFKAGADDRSINTMATGFDGAFAATGSGGSAGPNYQLVTGDFPFHKLSNTNNAGSTVLFDSNDIGGSQGVYLRSFISISGLSNDNCDGASTDNTFSIATINTRRVTGRNTPSNINAAFNFRNFWDGRAREVFNGVDPHGADTTTAVIYRTVGGSPSPVSVLITNSSAASQAVGPPNNPTEMSCGGRSFPELGRKMMGLIPLGQQQVHATDSVLGAWAHPTNGLTTSYQALIMSAFQPDLWNASGMIGGFTQMEMNFSLYWGLAIQLYEDTLVSDDAPIDRYAAGQTSALTAQDLQGLSLFTGKARCSQCHSGPVFTDAVNGSGGHAFMNAGVRPNAEDAGDILQGAGHFKTPSLRNIELTGPYFHNGSQATLRQVVDFYNRGADFASSDTDSQVRPLGLTDAEKSALVSFMLKLTDSRVRYRKAPFDSPALCVPNGEPSTVMCLPAIGAAGTTTAVAQPFLSVNHFMP